MGGKDYITLNQNGTATINLSGYNGDKFIVVNQVRDIANMRILKKEQKLGMARGGPDVQLTHATGYVDLISRQNLVDNYRFVSGKKIQMQFLKSGKKYSVVGKCNKTYALIPLASNMKGMLNGNAVNKSKYIIAPLKEDGTIDTQNITQINKQLFRKLFIVQSQDIITRNIGRNISRDIDRRNRNNINNNSGVKKENGKIVASINKSLYNRTEPQNTNQSRNTGVSQNIGEVFENKYKYKAIGRVINENKETVAYLIENMTGKKKVIPEIKVMEMCHNKLISNLVLVRDNNGPKYLRGNGIRIESLPEYIQ